MSEVQILRALLKHRLPADEEEIFELFERTTAEYEEEIRRLTNENKQLRRRLEAFEKSDDKADVLQELVIHKAGPSEQQAWDYSLKQEDQDLHHIKKEEEEQEHLEGLEVYTDTCTSDDLKPQFLQFYQHQPKVNGDIEQLSSSSNEQIKAESVGADWNGFQPTHKSDQDISFHSLTDDMTSHSSEPDTDVSDIDCNEARGSPSCFHFLTNKMTPRGDEKYNGVKPFSDYKHRLRHGRVDTKQEQFLFFQHGETFDQDSHLKTNVVFHTGKKSFSCSECGKSFGQNKHLESHRLMHTGEKPFSCSECGRKFNHNSNLKIHMLIHTGEKPFSCSECGKSFNQKSTLKNHMITHTGEKPFICPQCGKAFGLKGNLKSHMIRHTREKMLTFC
ncbi:zinc finger protein 665-like [Thalassophryne amazonica]|uniref:zinc finger protein 665-like n=1 Tax=Thalassophryne amazonica TaxID=390379 RepID=UPI001470A6CF|nr:zinc finger protein 665-like [Thalassophryne amazonica]